MTFHAAEAAPARAPRPSRPPAPGGAAPPPSSADPVSSLQSPATSPASSASARAAPAALTKALPHPRLSSTLPPRATVYVVERLGRFSRLLYPNRGSPLLPLVDRVIAAYTTRRVDHATPSPGLDTLLPNGRRITVHAAWSLAIVDPKRLAYTKRPVDVDRFARMLVHTRLRDALVARADSPSLDNPHPPPDLTESVRAAINETAAKYGLSCPLFTVLSIVPTTDASTSSRNRSLNLAHAPANINAITHEGDSVLPELPLPPHAPAANARLHPHMIHSVPPLSPLPPAHLATLPRPPHAFPHAFPPLPQPNAPMPLPHIPPPVHVAPIPHPHLHPHLHPMHLAPFVPFSPPLPHPHVQPTRPREMTCQPCPQLPVHPMMYPKPPQHMLPKQSLPVQPHPKQKSHVQSQQQLHSLSQPHPQQPLQPQPQSHPQPQRQVQPQSYPAQRQPQPVQSRPQPNVLQRQQHQQQQYRPPISYPQPPQPRVPAPRAAPALPSLLNESDPEDGDDDCDDFEGGHRDRGLAVEADKAAYPDRQRGAAAPAAASRKPLYAPPPSPLSRLPSPPAATANLLPILLSRALSSDPLVPVVDPSRSPDRPTGPPAPSMESSPTLARHLHALPQTPSAELPSSDTGSETPVDLGVDDSLRAFFPSVSDINGHSGQEAAEADDASDIGSSPLLLRDDAPDSYDDAVNGFITRKATERSTLVTDISPPTSVDMDEVGGPVATDAIRGLDADGDVDDLMNSDDDEQERFDDGNTAGDDEDLDAYDDEDDHLSDEDRLLSPISSQRRSSLELLQQKRLGQPPSSPMSADGRAPRETLLELQMRRTTSLPSVRSGRLEDGPNSATSTATTEAEVVSMRNAVGKLVAPSNGSTMPLLSNGVARQHAGSIGHEVSAHMPRWDHVNGRGLPVATDGAPGATSSADSWVRRSSDVVARNLRSAEGAELLAKAEAARRDILIDALDDVDKGHKSPTEGLVVDVSSDDGSTEMWVDGASDSEREKFDDEALAKRVAEMPRRRRKSGHHRSGSRSRRRGSEAEGEAVYDGEGDDEGEYSSDEEFCQECGFHRQYDSYKYTGSYRHRSRRKSRRGEGSSGDHESRGDGEHSHSEHRHTSHSRSRSKSRGGSERSVDGSRKSEHRHGRKKGSSSKDGKSEKDSLSRSRNGERKRSHSKSRSGGATKNRDGDGGEKSRREGKGKSKSRQKKHDSGGGGVMERTASNHNTKLKSIYRHRAAESDSGPENPIPWYCEGQSEPDDSDPENMPKHLISEAERKARNGNKKFHSSYGRRDRYGCRHRAQHSRMVTFLYDNV